MFTVIEDTEWKFVVHSAVLVFFFTGTKLTRRMIQITHIFDSFFFEVNKYGSKTGEKEFRMHLSEKKK
jgi:hypothetical protein